MKPPHEELERRRPVWEAISAIFLDTEINEPWRADIVATLQTSGYSPSELDHILWSELCPVLYVNCVPVAGEWEAFDISSVERQIITRPAGRFRCWWAYISGGNMVRDA